MKKLLGLSTLLVMLVACNDVDGTLNVNSLFSVKDKKGREQQINPGYFKTEFKIDEGDRELEIKIEKASNGKDVKLKMIIPPGLDIPGFGGHVDLPGSKTGQAFDLAVDVNRQESQTQPIRTTESCNYPDRRYVCREHFDKKTNTVVKTCGYETFYRSGRKDVEYYTRYVTVDVLGQFLVPNATTKIAEFQGRRSDSQRITLWEGHCFPYGGW